MLLNILLFVIGVALIISGANYLTEGASKLARRFGLSPLMVGLTIVAFGTSAPELVVSLTSALKGSGDIALGNVIGSNIFNVLAIGGVTALAAPLSITISTIRREIPLLILASVVMVVMTLDTMLGGVGATSNVISRGEGLTLLGFFSIFLAYTIAISRDDSVQSDHSPSKDAPEAAQRPVWLLLVMILGGLFGLVYGGNLFVDAASAIARSFGVSEAMIGLTLVAAGTSMPELATSLVAALKGEHELAIGNIVGSGIFNVFLVLGLISTITPIQAVGIDLMDLGIMVLSAVLLYFLGVFFGSRVITRLEGALLLGLYIVYTAYLIVNI